MWNAAAILLCLALPWQAEARSEASKPLPAQTDVERAQHHFDAAGVPLLEIAGHGRQRHPAWIALYALAFAGVDAYEPTMEGLKNEAKFRASINWLTANLKQNQGGLWVWEYGFDSTYNDISIKAPWSSAFAQATGIQALLASWRVTGNPGNLSQALKAAEALYVPLAKGGFLFQRGQDIWFEEIPSSVDNPGHILNGHMRALLALKELADASGDKRAYDHYQRGKETLLRWLPLYDTGYWLRYDLNPRKRELLFRIVNPYGYASHPLAVDRITLRDPLGSEVKMLDVGGKDDAVGPQRIAGLHWGMPEILKGRSVRRLVPAALDDATSSGADDLRSPHTYFYLTLPCEKLDTLRRQDYELEIEYLDDAPANVTLQQRSVAPGVAFRDMRDGDLLLSGANQWRKWKIPLRSSDLGWWVGEPYAEKHARYLDLLTRDDPRLHDWKAVAAGYRRAVLSRGDYSPATVRNMVLPEQTPMLPRFSLDRDGAVLQHTGSRLVYHPYMLADQLLTGGDAIPENAELSFNRRDFRREPALSWFLNPVNQVNIGDATTYQFDFRNVYNDVVSEPPWTSAFTQAYVLKALVHASKSIPSRRAGSLSLARRVANSFVLATRDGGVTSWDRSGLPFFEEVPNNSHVLNAHLISINELSEAARVVNAPEIGVLAKRGVESLKRHLYQFDTGYWLRYDQNPRKELLFQLDWLEGTVSPQVESIQLRDPTRREQVGVHVGGRGVFDGAVRISGADWMPEERVDGRMVRSFLNGYGVREKAIPGGARHNVFFVGRLPAMEFGESFDVPVHHLVLRYKDVAKGRFALRLQVIHEGQTLQFVPLRGGIFSTVGDGRWKEAVFALRPQDLGWFKGVDYQTYEVDQLRRIADSTGDWFFAQYAARHAYFVERQKLGLPAVVEPVRLPARPLSKLVVAASSPTYPGHGFANALDGDPNDDYVAGIENEKQATVTLTLDPPSSPSELRIVWENASNYATTVRVYGYQADSTREKLVGEIRGSAVAPVRIPLSSGGELRSLRIDFTEFRGQSRLVLRQLEVR